MENRLSSENLESSDGIPNPPRLIGEFDPKKRAMNPPDSKQFIKDISRHARATSAIRYSKRRTCRCDTKHQAITCNHRIFEYSTNQCKYKQTFISALHVSVALPNPWQHLFVSAFLITFVAQVLLVTLTLHINAAQRVLETHARRWRVPSRRLVC